MSRNSHNKPYGMECQEIVVINHAQKQQPKILNPFYIPKLSLVFQNIVSKIIFSLTTVDQK